jgi:hypothetical protein
LWVKRENKKGGGRGGHKVKQAGGISTTQAPDFESIIHRSSYASPAAVPLFGNRNIQICPSLDHRIFSLEPHHIGWCSLQKQALALLAGLLAGAGLEQSRAGGRLEDLADTLIGTGRALEVLVGTDLLADLLTLLKDALVIC